MHAQIGTVREPDLRVKIVEQRALFDQNPKEFRDKCLTDQQKLMKQIVDARQQLKEVNIDYDLRLKISEICSELNVDGLRGDMVTNRAAKALVAFEGRSEVTPKDIYTIITLCLRHRLRKDPLETIDSGVKVQEVFNRAFGYD